MKLAVVAVALVACGRVGFDAQRVTGDDAPAPTTDTAAVTDVLTMPNGPALWLKMDTDPGTGIIDSAGGHTTLCTAGFCPSAVLGLHAHAYKFTGQELDVTYAPDLDASAGFTAALWVQLSALPGASSACPFNLPFNNANGWDTFALCIDGGGHVQFDSEDQSGNTALEIGPVIDLDVWHHIALTYDGTKRGYVDGIQVTTDTVAVGHGTQNPTVGGSRSAFYLTGTIDDVMYYTRALSAAEVAQLATP